MNAVDFDEAKTCTPGSVDFGDRGNDGIQVMSAPAIDTLSRAEIDVQISTAHRFPRSIQRFKSEAMSMATIDEDTAASCFYKLPRDGKIIEGPGVRLAEIIGSTWGNMRYGARIVAEDREYIVAQGVAHDLEKNVSASLEVRRRITKKNGQRYSADMINTTANAACSIALRNAIFRVIPKTFVNQIYEAAKQVAIGDATTLVERRAKALDYFTKMGVMVDRILSVLGKHGIEDIDLEDLATLTGLKTAIKDGDTTVDEAFPSHEPNKPKTSGSDKAFEQKPVESETQSSEQTAPISPPSPEPKTKEDYIKALQTLQEQRGFDDETFNNLVCFCVEEARDNWTELPKDKIASAFSVISNDDACIKLTTSFDEASKGGNLFNKQS